MKTMKVNRDELLKAIAAVWPAANREKGMNIFGGMIRFYCEEDHVELFAASTGTFILSKAKAEGGSSFECWVNGTLLKNMVESLDEVIELNAGQGPLEVIEYDKEGNERGSRTVD